MIAIDHVVILDLAHLFPQGIITGERCVADNDRSVRVQTKIFAKLFHVFFGIPGERTVTLNAVMRQVVD